MMIGKHAYYSMSSMLNMHDGKLAYMTLGERVKARRLELGWSQAVLAKKVGITRNAISLLENGNTKGLKPENLIRTADVLCYTPHELVLGIRGKQKPASTTFPPLSDAAVELAHDFDSLPREFQRIVRATVTSQQRRAARELEEVQKDLHAPPRKKNFFNDSD